MNLFYLTLLAVLLLAVILHTIFIISIKKQQTKMENKQQAFADALAKIDTATNEAAAEVTRIGGVVEELKQQIKDAGLSAEEEDAILAKLEDLATSTETLATGLTAIGKPADAEGTGTGATTEGEGAGSTSTDEGPTAQAGNSAAPGDEI